VGAVLVTGAAGFIGSHLVGRLLSDGQRVVGIDSFDDFYDPAIKAANLASERNHPRFQLIEGDIRDSEAVSRAFDARDIDAVIHLAARAGVRPSIEQPDLYTSVNLVGTTRVLECARQHGVRRVVFGSSSSVYGNNEKVPFAEDDPVDHPISPYAATKRAGELIAHTYHHLFDMDVACLRFFTVYGPRQRPDLAIHKFASLMSAGREIELYGDGTSARDYTFVTDIVDGIVRAMERVRGFRIWNLGGSDPVALSTLVDRLAAELDVEPRVRRLPPQPGDVARTWADVSRAARELEWSPGTGLQAGLREFVRWLKQEQSEHLLGSPR
jgi:UDP-glucuronate 4-epimerase